VLFINSQDAMSVGMMQTPLGEMMFQADINAGRLLGVDVVRSLNIPQGTAIMVDAAQVATAFDTPQFDVSDIATVVEASADAAAPTMAGDTSGTGKPGAVGTAGQVPRDGGIPVSGGAGAAGTGATARSLWQTYSVGVRMVLPVAWGVMRTGSVQAVNTLSW
jgi:hypothetical protein